MGLYCNLLSFYSMKNGCIQRHFIWSNLEYEPCRGNVILSGPLVLTNISWLTAFRYFGENVRASKLKCVYNWDNGWNNEVLLAQNGLFSFICIKITVSPEENKGIMYYIFLIVYKSLNDTAKIWERFLKEECLFMCK